jgi:OmpA-OmpF porin, OOP family
MVRSHSRRFCMGDPRLMKVVVTFAVLVLTAVAARAQPVSGLYVQGSGGLALPRQQSVTPASTTPGPPPTSAAAAAAAINGSPGAAQTASAGWGLGNGFRLEVEGVHAAQGVGTAN